MAHAPRIARALRDYDIATPLRAAHFLAQCIVESGSLRYMREIWGPSAAQVKYDPPHATARRLGNTKKGDGYMYRGAGPIQTTGKDNFADLAAHLLEKGEPDWDVVAHPEMVEGKHAWSASAYWWQSNDANREADGGDDEDDVRRVSRLVNRGNANHANPAFHEEERIAAFRRVAKALREAGAWRITSQCVDDSRA